MRIVSQWVNLTLFVCLLPPSGQIFVLLLQIESLFFLNKELVFKVVLQLSRLKLVILPFNKFIRSSNLKANLNKRRQHQKYIFQ